MRKNKSKKPSPPKKVESCDHEIKTENIGKSTRFSYCGKCGASFGI